jgi:hypothetical protein
MEFLNPYDAAPLTRSTFFRGVESLVIDTLTPTAIRLQFDDAPPQVMKLSDAIEAVFFQSNLEHELVRTGWTLEGFASTRGVLPRTLLVQSATDSPRSH